ncbi:hypothetical protein Q2475_29450, partial [Escherichia coli]|nr:hypothetical protein [Escherichia coli]
HHMIGLDEIAADLDATHRRAALDDLRHPAAMQLPAMSGSLQALGKLHAEGMAVGDLLVRRVDAADEGLSLYTHLTLPTTPSVW